jgi:NAD(P)-dependent dehydrogenase (short-subunit alcohol dehydrogenase family)
MQNSARRAIILGGTGVLGRAAAQRLLDAGWAVDLVGRRSPHVPNDLTIKGARFLAVDRQNSDALGHVMGSGADLLVDALCYTSADARQLLPFLRDVTSVVVLSSKAVYADAEGRHVNSEKPPHFPSPIREDQPTVKLRLQFARGLRSMQGRRRDHAARQRRSRDSDQGIEGPRRWCDHALRMAFREANNRPTPGDISCPSRVGGKSHDSSSQYGSSY